MVDESHALAKRIQDRLSQPNASSRAALCELVLDALLAQPTSSVFADPEVENMLLSVLTESHVRRAADDVVLPALTRIQEAARQRDTSLRDLLPDGAPVVIAELLARGQGPRFAWLRRAVDPALMRELFGPVVQDTLVAFTQNLPFPGAAVGGPSGRGGAGLGGLVGNVAKQVSRSAGQIADLGKGMMGGLGAELERRLQTVTREFSQTAMGGAREVVRGRLASDEGRALLVRMREQALERVLQTPVQEVVDDFMRLPFEDVAALAATVVEHNRSQELVESILRGECRALLATFGEQSFAGLLHDAGLLEPTRALVLRWVDPPLAEFFASDAFSDWLEGLLAEV